VEHTDELLRRRNSLIQVGVFPEGEEVFVSSERLDASDIGALLQSSPCKTIMENRRYFRSKTKSPTAAGL